MKSKLSLGLSLVIIGLFGSLGCGIEASEASEASGALEMSAVQSRSGEVEWATPRPECSPFVKISSGYWRSVCRTGRTSCVYLFDTATLVIARQSCDTN